MPFKYPKVLCSMCGFGPPTLIDAAVKNALRFVHCTLLVLHLSVGSRMSTATMSLQGIMLNPVQFKYRRHGPNVFNSHLSNLELLVAATGDREAFPDNSKVVFLPGQAVFTRDCTRELEESEMSMPIKLEFDLQRSSMRGWFGKVFEHFVHEGGDGPMRASPIAVMPHEGSFFPLALVRSLLPLALQTTLRKNCSFPACTLEEVVFPTLVAQYVHPYSRDADSMEYSKIGKPLVERVFNWSLKATSFLALPIRTCGRKLVHDALQERESLRAFRLLRHNKHDKPS